MRSIPLRLLLRRIASVVFLVGCGDTCFVITGIFPRCRLGDPPTCKLAQRSAHRRRSHGFDVSYSGCPRHPIFGHVFVTLSGIDSLPSALLSEDSPGWQGLAPELDTRPVRNESDGGFIGSARFMRTQFNLEDIARASAGCQIGLRLRSNHAESRRASATTQRVTALVSTVSSQPTARSTLSRSKQRAHHADLSRDRVTSGFFDVLPDTGLRLSIEFNPFSSIAASAGAAVQSLRVFSATRPDSCDFSARLDSPVRDGRSQVDCLS